MIIDEPYIIREAQRGSIVAFEELVKKYDKHVLQLAYSMLNNTEDAEDIYQEIFVKVFKNIYKFKFKSEFSTWLYRIVVNHCLNYKKKKNRAPLLTIDENMEQKEFWQPCYAKGEKTPEENMLNNELSEKIQDGLEKLSPRQNTVFVLRHYHGKKLKEIAEIMACSEGAVKNYLFRATRKMQACLKSYSQRVT